MDIQGKNAQNALYVLFLNVVREKTRRENPNRIKIKEVAELIKVKPELLSRYLGGSRDGSGTPADILKNYLVILGVPMFEIVKCVFKELTDEDAKTIATALGLCEKDREKWDAVSGMINIVSKDGKGREEKGQ